MALIWGALRTDTPVAATPPMVTVAPDWKPEPLMVIAVLPAAGPELGLTDATAGGAGGTKVTTALLRAVGAAWLVATTARFTATETIAGAMSSPLVEIVPTFE